MLRIRVRPGSSRTYVGGAYGDSDVLLVAVRERAVDGAANAAIVAAVAEALSVPARAVRIRAGHTSRSKTLQIDVDDAEAPRVVDALAGLLETTAAERGETRT
jgi:uncharacterized protein YggU (UPF0235/DUF167 family)